MEKMSCSCTWGTGNINHNFNKKSREKQDHIDNSKIDDNIILKEISPKTIEQEFNKIFAQDVEEYNSRQKRNDRKIDSYYQKCLDDKRIKAPFREVIYQVGNKDDVKNKDKKDKMIKSLTKFYNEFEKNYPSLKIIGAVIHLDEATPHLHLDVVPYAENNKRGMKHKVSFEKAIEQMGFKPEESQVNKNVKDPLIFNGFRNHSMQLLENILNEEGIERDIKNNTKKHLQPSDFKKERDAIEELKQDPELIKKAKEEVKAYNEEIQKMTQKTVEDNMEAVGKLDKTQNELKKSKAEYEDWEKKKKKITDEVLKKDEKNQELDEEIQKKENRSKKLDDDFKKQKDQEQKELEEIQNKKKEEQQKLDSTKRLVVENEKKAKSSQYLKEQAVKEYSKNHLEEIKKASISDYVQGFGRFIFNKFCNFLGKKTETEKDDQWEKEWNEYDKEYEQNLQQEAELPEEYQGEEE